MRSKVEPHCLVLVRQLSPDGNLVEVDWKELNYLSRLLSCLRREQGGFWCQFCGSSLRDFLGGVGGKAIWKGLSYPWGNRVVHNLWGFPLIKKHFLSAYLKAIRDCVCPLEAKNLIHDANGQDDLQSSLEMEFSLLHISHISGESFHLNNRTLSDQLGVMTFSLN